MKCEKDKTVNKNGIFNAIHTNMHGDAAPGVYVVV